MGDAACEPANRFELLRLSELFLEEAPAGDVPHERGDAGVAVGAEAGHGQFAGEFGAVGFDAGELDELSAERSVALRQVAAEGVHVRGTIGRRQEELHVAAEHVHARAPEHALGGRVELADVQLGVDGEDRVVRRFENGALARLDFDADEVDPVGEIQRRRREEQRQPARRRWT